MDLRANQGTGRPPPWNYGYAILLAPRPHMTGFVRFALAAVIGWAVVLPDPSNAQQASQPGFDPRQTEKRFDALQSERAATAPRPALPTPRVAGSVPAADATPLAVLRKVSLTGAGAIRRE